MFCLFCLNALFNIYNCGALLSLGCRDGWGCLLPWLGDCLWGMVGLCVFGGLLMLAEGSAWRAFWGCVLLLPSSG